MLVRFDEIPDSGLVLDVADVSWICDQEINGHGAVECSISLSKMGERVLLTGRLILVVGLACDRCLEVFSHPLDTSFRMEFLCTAGDGRQFGSD